MICPVCNIALKTSVHRRVGLNYCPLCGGTWLNRTAFENLRPTAGADPRAHRRTLRLAILAVLVVVGGLLVTVSVGAVKLWPAVRSWTGALLRGEDTALTSQVRQLASRMGDPRLLELARGGVDSAVLSVLAGNSGFESLLSSVATLPNLGPLVQNGAYRKALEEAVRQNVPNIGQIRLDQVASPGDRALVDQVQQVVAKDSQAAAAVGTVNTDVLNLLRSQAFTRLCQSPAFSRLLSSPASDKEAE